MEKKYEIIKNVILELAEDGRAAILFERQDGTKISLMCPPMDNQDPEQATALTLKEV